MLEIRDLVVRRGPRRVVDGISLSVRAGETVAVVGPNGAGKTTLLEAVVGALPIAAGEIQVQGRQLGSLTSRARWLGHLSGEAEPTLEARKRLGFQVFIFLIVLAGLLYFTKKKVWREVGAH